MVNIHRIKALIKLKGMKIGHVCAQLGLTHTYFSNVESGKTTMSDERIHKVAEILGTTYEYLTDQTNDPRLPEEIEAEQGIKTSIEKMFERSDTNSLFDRMAEKEKVFVEPVETHKVAFDLAGVTGVETDHQKMAQLLGMIAKKPSAKKDMEDILTYLEFIAKRGE